MQRLICFAYGTAVYTAFLGVFVYLIGFVAGLLVPKHIDSGEPGPLIRSMMINVGLLGLFAVQHMIMARPAFKRRWTRIIHPAIERSTFVLATITILSLMVWQWRPLPSVVWDVQLSVVRNAIYGVSFLGWGIVLYSTFLIDHFDLFGMRQVWFHLINKPYRHPPFIERSLYRFVRHPLMVGFLIAFWATPTMTIGHLLFAAVTTAYILIGVRVEERDLSRHLGADYEEYRRRTPLFVPVPKRRGATVQTVRG